MSLFSTIALGFTALCTSFNMRNDLPLKLGLISKDTFYYEKKGSRIMINHKWMEESPQMKDGISFQNKWITIGIFIIRTDFHYCLIK